MLDRWWLYEDMRVEDMLEVIGLGTHLRQACGQSFEHSTKAFTIMQMPVNKLAGSFGVCDTAVDGVGCVWMLGTHRLYNIKTTFIRHSREWLDELMGDYRMLTNLVAKSNLLSMRWLKWLGAEFIREPTEGYLEFIIINTKD